MYSYICICIINEINKQAARQGRDKLLAKCSSHWSQQKVVDVCVTAVTRLRSWPQIAEGERER